jgi:two-component system, NarL family, sensor histidine kinase FusK
LEGQKKHRKRGKDLYSKVMSLAESISPSAWRDRGITAVLKETVGGVLFEAGIAYQCDVSRRSLEALSPVIQAAIFRVAGEAMAVLSESYLCAHIDLSVRIFRWQRMRWVARRIDSTEDEAHVARAMQHVQERHRIGAKLGACMQGADEVQRFVRVFDGTLRTRRYSDGMRVSVLLREGPQRGEHERKAPIRWLVK